MMAALWAARSGADTVLCEGSSACGRKILISGGGRCNLLPSESSVNDFFSTGSQNVLKRLFRTWRLPDCREFFEQTLDLPLIEEEDSGKLFPECQSARMVRDRLLEALQDAGVHIAQPFRVTSMEFEGKGDSQGEPASAAFRITDDHDQVLEGAKLILATGGCSIPKTGSDGFGYQLAQNFGHSCLPPYPALVPLHSKDPGMTSLSGISLPVTWRAMLQGKVREERTRELLFTHQGFSGPAVLDASHWAVREQANLEIAWGALDEADWEDHWQSRGRRELLRGLSDLLPRRLAEDLIRRSGLRPDVRIGTLTRPQRNRMLQILCHFQLPIQGNGGFRVAEVTGGGIPLNEVQPSTLESRSQPGLYLCGEILDVIGRIGGYNFYWAWVTGRLAGESAARDLA